MQATIRWPTMQTSYSDRSNKAQGALVLLLSVAALALLALVLARLTWAWLAPAAEAVAPAAVGASPQLDFAPRLFGAAKRQGPVAAPTGVAVTLLGVVAATPGRHGYALVQLDGKHVLAVREGDTLAPGIDLVEVDVGGIIVDRGGVRESLALPEKSSPRAPATLPVQ